MAILSVVRLPPFFSLFELPCPKEIRGAESPSSKNYEKTEAIWVKIEARDHL